VATFVIGDIHGCRQTLQRLLERIGWDPAADELWLVGDLVNRGPDSLEVLRWAVKQERLVAVLGNHDLHLLALADGLVDKSCEDSLDEVLDAPDGDCLLDWLRARPFLHLRDGVAMVHAGLWPRWEMDEVIALATEASDRLSGPAGREFLLRLSTKPRPRWLAGVKGDDRLAAAVSIFTRLRIVRPDGRPKLGFTGPPEEAPAGCVPWFMGSRVVEGGFRVVFGHWAQLGFLASERVICLDSGCVYGGQLTALRLEDRQFFHQPVVDDVPVLPHE
jgi:bis(5'-nucleosyl)-tetraphosphatase (symmetrical)